MGKLLRLRDYILISAAFAGEIFEEVRIAGGFLPSAMQNQYGFVPERYKKTSYLTEVSEMLSVGNIERTTDKNGRTYLTLTSAGKKEFKRKFKLTFDSKRWKEDFMLCIFDIPEKEKKIRDLVRLKLAELGFGMLQKSVWISPYHFEEDLREFLENHGLGDKVFVLSAKKLLVGNLKPLVKKIWKLDGINRNYKNVINRIQKALKLERIKSQKYINEAFQMYLQTLSSDPFLPEKLLPKNWARPEALNLINRHLRQ